LKAGTSTRRLAGASGFTMIELIVVILLTGILGAIGASRFFDDKLFAGRAYADQVKSMIRYAQKLAVAQNREVYLRSDVTGFAVCFDAACGAGSLAPNPGGTNDGSSYTKAYCISGGTYVANWVCMGKPANVAVSVAPARPELAAGGYFYFDAMGRPHNKADPLGAASTFGTMIVAFASGTNTFSVTVETETGYVH
jgi:MSHA pilin protein MshC